MGKVLDQLTRMQVECTVENGEGESAIFVSN